MGCINAVKMAGDKRGLCPFCRTPEATLDVETIKRIKKRVEAGDAEAMYQLGHHYHRGEMGLPQDYGKAIELWLRAGELGHAASYYAIGLAYYNQCTQKQYAAGPAPT